MALAIGEKAPDFALPAAGGDLSGDVATLTGLLERGRLALAFYPKDNTSG